MEHTHKHKSQTKQNTKHTEQSQYKDLPSSPYRETKTFLEWEAPGRPFRPRSREYFINAFLIMMAVEIILFLFSQYLLMMVVFSLIFLSFALSSVPPKMFTYKISSEGILVEKTFFIWEELYDFYFFKDQGEEETLHITTKSFFPGEITLTLGNVSIDELKMILLPYLPFREYVEPTFLEKMGKWLERNFPLERTNR